MENVHVKFTLMRTSVLPVNPLTLDFQVAKVCPFGCVVRVNPANKSNFDFRVQM